MKDTLKAIVLGGLFAVPFLTLYVENDYFFPFITGKNFWFRIIVDVTFAAWVLLALYEPKYRPKWSWLIGSFGVLLVVMFFANLFGMHPSSSFWSNFERMDGYVSLLHTFLYFVILGSVMHTETLWRRLLNVSLVVAFAVALYGLLQYTGALPGSDRIDSRLGNAAYMAIYMLFHIFIAFWQLVETKKPSLKLLYGLLAALFVFVLIETGTRGTAVGLAAGIFVMSGYIAIFGKQYSEFRKYAIGAFILLLLGVGGFIAGRDSDVVQNNQNLSRIANISLTDLTVRSTIWTATLQAVPERPFLGYGQSNFNFVFNEYYQPSLYGQEQWFDRGHNIFVDWLITGGILGLLAYLSIFAALAWYLLIRPIVNRADDSFTVLERGVLLGILAGYFTHNLVVFDNIISYIFFAIILGLVHSRVGTPIAKLANAKVDNAIITQFATPVVVVVVGAFIYFAHVPGMQAAADIIKGFREPDPVERLERFKDAIDRDAFAFQEVVEQLAQQTINIVRSPDVPLEVKELYARYTDEQIKNLIAWKPNDARVHVFAGTYYRSINQLDQAAAEMARARELSPLKQAIIYQQGFIELSRGNSEAAVDYFKTAYELYTDNLEALEFYVGTLLAVGETETAEALIAERTAAEDDQANRVLTRLAQSDYVVSNANQAGLTNLLIQLFEKRVELSPNDAQNWATLAFLYDQIGDEERAIEILNTGQERVPEFAPLATCVIDNIENGREPTEGCQ
jgi:O-antigen ligase/tetratricopeptide (TPR) repeat protein